MIRDSSCAVALTGAGLSTAAGIPDFRGPDGLYVTRRYDPDRVFEYGAFLADPEPFFEFSRDFLEVIEGVQPTATHRVLAALEQRGHLAAVVTQNVDGLHQAAGSERVLSIHGDYTTATCIGCGRGVSLEDVRRLMADSRVPECERCGGVVKPDLVFFGEAVRDLERAAQAVMAADLMLVLGSSLTVYPAAALPNLAGCPVVVVNQGEVGLTEGPDRHVVQADLDGFFGAVAEELGL